MSIEALVVSAGEPQLERCLKAVKNQKIPFSNVVHIDNVIPENEAFNRGMEMVSDELVMKVDGDFILYGNAVETALNYIGNDGDSVFMYAFGLYDSFLKEQLCGCVVYRTPVFKKHNVKYPNFLKNDVWASRTFGRLGFIRKDPYRRGIVVGTHFDTPDEFQVFRRFYSNGVKYGKAYVWKTLGNLYKKTEHPLYLLALKSVEFGIKKGYYPTSHNLNFDKEMFEEFKKCELQ